MSELGEFLARFYSPEPTFRALRAGVRHTRKASVDGASSSRRPVIGRRRSGGNPHCGSEATLMIWAIPPDHVRVETERTRDGQAESTVEVTNSDDTWKRFANGTVQAGARSARRDRGEASLPTEYRRHFDRGLIRECFAALTLEAIGSCQVAGRECLRIRAVETPAKQLWPHWLAWEADSFEFAADVERSVLLSIVGTVAGAPVETHEVVEIAFDEELDESLFVYEPRPDERVEPVTPVAERITLEAAVSRAPFTVLRPTWLPEGDRLESQMMYHRTGPDFPDPHLTMLYGGCESFDHLWVNQRSDREKRMQEELQWEVVTVGVRSLEVSDPSPEEGLRIVVFEQHGNWVDIVSDMPLEKLQEFAISFLRADR